MKVSSDEFIKTFLKVKTPKIVDKPYYELDLKNDIFIIHDDIAKSHTKKTSKIKLNKIYTDNNDNNYIFKETCSHIVEDMLNGISNCIIDYGETASDKLNLLFGDIKDNNKNQIGIFQKILEEIFISLNLNEKNPNHLNIYISYIYITDTKIIDLSNFLYKDTSKIDLKDFKKDEKSIKNDKNIINYIKKIKTDNCNNVISFINKIISLLLKLEIESKEKSDNFKNDEYLFSRANISVIIYLTDNNGNNISSLTFILLNGSEIIYVADKDKILDLVNYEDEKIKKKVLSQTKSSINTKYTYDSILYFISQNYKFNYEKKETPNYESEEQKFISNLISVLYFICFQRSIKNIKFMIFGNIIPNVGYYNTVRDTIMFLFHCNKIKPTNKININKIEEKSLETQNNILNTKVENLNLMIEDKNQRIKFLETNYKKQIETLIKQFGFKGDINILLDGNEFTSEAKECKEIREYVQINKCLKDKVSELEKQLVKSNQKIETLKNQIMTINKDEIMIKLTKYSKHLSELKDEESKKNNILLHKVDDLSNDIIKKNKIIEALKEDNEIKNNIIQNFPLTNNNILINNKKNGSKINSEYLKTNELNDRKENSNKNINNTKNNMNSNNINKETNKNNNINSKKNNENSNSTINKEISNLNKKYNELLEKNHQIINMSRNELEDKDIFYSNELKLTENELIKLNKLFYKMIHEYHYFFMPKVKEHKMSLVSLQQKLLEFDQLILKLEKEVNQITFPKLHKILELNNQLSTNYKTLIDNKRKNFVKEKSKSQKFQINNEKIKFDGQILNFFDDEENNIKSDINKENKISYYTKEKMESMYKIDVINYTLELIEKTKELEKKCKNFFEITNKEILVLNKDNTQLTNNLQKTRSDLAEQLDKYYSNKIVIDSQNKFIEKLNQGLLLKKIKLYNTLDKNKNIFNKKVKNLKLPFFDYNIFSNYNSPMSESTSDYFSGIQTKYSSPKNTLTKSYSLIKRPFSTSNSKCKL